MCFTTFRDQANEEDVGMALVAILIGNDDFYLHCLGWPLGPSFLNPEGMK
jgi:hypothetical protein